MDRRKKKSHRSQKISPLRLLRLSRKFSKSKRQVRPIHDVPLVISVQFEVIIDGSVDPVSDETVGDIQQDARTIIEDAGEEIQTMAQEICPVRTGALRDSIWYEVEDVTGLEVGASAPYAPHVEYGTVNMAAQPFLRPAIDDVQPRLQEQLDEMIADHLSEDTDEENLELEFDVESGYQ